MSYHVQNYKYIYELPQTQHKELCEMLNQNSEWEELAGRWMKFSALEIQKFKQQKNPSEVVLKQWGYCNHTIYELFFLLSKMQHYQGMLLLKNFVSSKLHVLLDNCEEILKNSQLNDMGAETRYSMNQSMSLHKILAKLPNLPNIPYNELESATGNWKKENELGSGGFGTVFKGYWKNTTVAIKKIEPKGFYNKKSFSRQMEQSFNEIIILNSSPHDNILPLYAYSLNGEMPCLVFKFMVNGSLADNLKFKWGSESLNWTQRQEIAKGVACGLQYMHRNHVNPLIHGDIKSANILLDKNFEPKIGDFGLARAGSFEEAVVVSTVFGTKYYLPEDFIYGKELTTKIDTYSYGIVLFELATGFPVWVKEAYKPLKEHVDSFYDEELHQLKDPKAGNEYDDVYYHLIKLGKWCSNKKAKDRPEMLEVYEKFN